jgi:hypothetical protein
MGYYDPETDETPEERRMRLLAEMGSPFLGNRRDADLGTIDSGGVFGMGPQGFQVQPDAPGLGAAWLDPGQRVPGSYRDPGSDYVDPPPRLGNLFAKPGEPPAPEHDGLLYNGTRSPAGQAVLAKETPTAAISAGPIASPDDINVQGANNQDRTNAPRPADAPKTAAPISLPSLAGGLGTGLAANYASMAPQNAGPGTRMGATPAAAEAGESDSAPASGTPASPIPQPQVAAVADGLSRKPGSPAAMTWLQDNADLFIALGAGLLSGRNIGSGIIEGLRLANEQKTTSAKQKLEAEKNQAEQLKKAAHTAALMKAFPGQFTAETALAMSDDADLVKRAQQKLYPDATEEGKIIRSPEEKVAAGIRPDDPQNYYQLPGKRPEPIGTAPTKEEKPSKPLTAEGKARWNIPPDDNRPYADNGDKPPTLIGGQSPFQSPAQAAQTAEATARVSAGTDQATKLAANRLQAQTNMSLAQYTERLLNEVEPGAITGATAQLREKFGLNVDANGGKVQALQAALERLANDQHKVGTGSVSDADLRSFQKQVPNLFGTKEGNQLIMDTIKGVAEYNDKATEAAAQWRAGKINLDQFNERIEKLPNPMDNFTRYQAERGAASAPAAATPAASAPEATPGATREFTYDPRKGLGRIR